MKGNKLEWTTKVNLNASRTQDKMESLVVCSLEGPHQQASDNDVITGKAAVTIKHSALVHVSKLT